MTRLILASASPRRLTLLAQIGVTPDEVIATNIDESVRPDETPRQLALRLAHAKAEAAGVDDAIVIAADTVVAVGRRILPKGETEADARMCLKLLSGRGHRVFTGVAVRWGGKTRARLVETRVRFRVFSPADIEMYVASGEWEGKAGGYALQGMAGRFITQLVGSYTSVIGLPLYETSTLLDAAFAETRR